MSFAKIAVLGLGNVGRLAARLLHEAEFTVTAFDARRGSEVLPFERRLLDVSSKPALDQALAACAAVLSCLPYHLNGDVASLAHARGLHYFDLTEDVATTKSIRNLAETATAAMQIGHGAARIDCYIIN